MRTFKQHVIELEEGESLEIRATSAKIKVTCVDALERDCLSVEVPYGTSLAGFTAAGVHPSLGEYSSLIDFVPQGTDEGRTDQLDGPMQFVIFHENQPT